MKARWSASLFACLAFGALSLGEQPGERPVLGACARVQSLQAAIPTHMCHHNLLRNGGV